MEASSSSAESGTGQGPVKGPELTKLMVDVKDGKLPPQAEVLMAILLDNYKIARTSDGDPVVTSNRFPSVAIPLRGRRSARSRLSGDMYTLLGKAPNQEALSNMISMVEGVASQKAAVREVHVRTASLDGVALLDLGRDDGLAALIRPGGDWVLRSQVPVLWKRGAMVGALPVPAEPGTVPQMPAPFLFNFREPGQWVTAVACQVAALLYPQSTHPVEICTADSSGALKTATLRGMKRWTDPGPTVPAPKDNKSWAVTASSCYRAGVDNVSNIPAWWSDLLCKSASGDSWADRELYTDGEVSAWSYYAVPMLDGIGLVDLRDDLADRAVRHHLHRPEYFLDDAEVEAAWQKQHPAMLSWLLDTSAAVARLHWSGLVQRPRSGRMATFEWVLKALDEYWQTGGSGMRWYKASQADAAADAVESDPVAAAITSVITEPWTGYPRELHAKVQFVLPDRDESGRMWSEQKFGKRLSRAASAVTKLGWTMQSLPRDRNKQRRWNIEPPAD